MAFGLTIGTERASVLQNAIQDELTKRGYSTEGDHVMSEYITIMLINNKTEAQITAELIDLIGSDFDTEFVKWLFAEAAKGAPESEAAPTTAPEPTPSTSQPKPPRDSPPHLQHDSRRPPNGPRGSGPLYQQAIAQATSTSPTAQKRPASARSPSPTGHANKSRRLDLPTGPRAMQRDGPSGSRSLLDRMGGPSRNGPPPYVHDEVQARIDNITGTSTPEMMLMQQGGYPMNGMPGMDMGAMSGMANPMMLQEMMMGQMALMAQMAGAMGILNPAAMGMNGQFPGQPGMGGDMGPMNGNMNGMSHGGSEGRGRGRGRGGPRGVGGRGRGGHNSGPSHGASEPTTNGTATLTPIPDGTLAIANPAPIRPAPTAGPIAAPQISPSPSQHGRATLTAPERPQSPTLCKFGLRCTNAACRYSHPSPVATPESGVVLSNDPCEKGKDCKDKDCVKAHVSPAAIKPASDQLNPKAPAFTPSVQPPHHTANQSQVPCRFGATCTRPGCTFLHPNRQNSTPCRFGAACTKASCPFQHPEGRGVLPTTFHRGLSSSGGLVNVSGSEAGASHNKSVTFNTTKTNATAAELEKKVKEVEEKKSQAQAAVAQAQAAAAAKKDDGAKSVSVAV